jgi:hypothetical protein
LQNGLTYDFRSSLHLMWGAVLLVAQKIVEIDSHRRRQLKSDRIGLCSLSISDSICGTTL